jgi:hypothetical protein
MRWVLKGHLNDTGRFYFRDFAKSGYQLWKVTAWRQGIAAPNTAAQTSIFAAQQQPMRHSDI